MDGKCTREPEYTSLGMPLALNYMPCYPFPFVPDEHYLFLKEPRDLLLLESADPEKFAAASESAWKNYFSPWGSMNLLVKLVQDEKYRKSVPGFWKHFETRQEEYKQT